MENTILIVVDMQKDFVTGALGSVQAQSILPKVAKKVKSFEGRLIFTMDTHGEDYFETQEGRRLPVKHCVKGTDGWNTEGILAEYEKAKNAAVYEKLTFGSIALAQDLRRLNEQKAIDAIELVGVCTDICVISNALLLKAYLPEVTIRVDSSCCAGVTVQKHEAALETMRSCQIEVY